MGLYKRRCGRVVGKVAVHSTAVPTRPAITEVQTETVYTTDELFKIARQVDLQIDYAVNTVSNIGLVFHFHS